MALKFRGLVSFVHEVKKCENQEQEIEKIDEELRKIRRKFNQPEALNGYRRKKYLWKLMFIKMMGVDVNFGYKEILALISSPKFSEKYTAYVTAGYIVNEFDEDDVLKSIKDQVRTDLFSMNESFQSLALTLIGTTASQELAVPLVKEVLKLALGEFSQITPAIRKKALLCLLRIFRKYPGSFENTKNWVAPINAMLEKFSELSVLNACLALIEGIISINYSKHWDAVGSNVLAVLHKIALSDRPASDYLHYGVPHPWLQIKCLKVLQALALRKDKEFVSQLNVVLRKFMGKIQLSQVKSRNNTEFAVSFEAILLIVKYRAVVDFDLQNQVLSFIFLFLELPEPNIKYLTFESMTSILILPRSEDFMKDHVQKVLDALNDLDVSMRRRALDLLYLMCNSNNVGTLTEELINYSENCDANLKEELILKIAILAEKFAPDLNWYVDVIIRLLSKSGDFITDDIWWRVCQIATGFGDDSRDNKRLQTYAVEAALNALSAQPVHENLVKLGSYVLPEFGLGGSLSATKIFGLLDRHFSVASLETKCMLFDGYAKIAAFVAAKKTKQTSEEKQLFNQIISLFQMYSDHIDVELQKRAFEYMTLLYAAKPEQLEAVFKAMPTFHESVQDNNPLLSKMIQMMGKNSGKVADPTVVNEGVKLIKAQNEIIGATKEKDVIIRKVQQSKFEDMFIQQEQIHVKFEQVPVFDSCKQRLALKGVGLLLSPENLEGPRYKFQEFKNLLINPSGVYSQDNALRIDFGSEVKSAQIAVVLTFNSLVGPLKILKVNVLSDGGMNHQLAPIKEGPAPQIRLLFTNTDAPFCFPELQVFYTQNAAEKTTRLILPVFVHRFLVPKVLEESKYMEIYSKMTLEKEYFKLDDFIRNPAPDQNLNEVMSKICDLLSKVMRLHAQPYPSRQNIKMVYASGQLTRDDPKSPNAPVVIEIECFEEYRDQLRLSVRCFFSPFIAHSIYQLIVLFLTPAK